MTQFYGIRHHGPGSTRSLLAALQQQQPDSILIEGPADANALLPHVIHPDMRPPVALLLYNPANLQQASFFPFAEYSPEWQAIRFALTQGVRVQFMDLPLSLGFALQAENTAPPAQPGAAVPQESRWSLDPFQEIAALAGYSDPERWWEAMFERGEVTHPFPVVAEMMATLRESKSQPETSETLLREAYMRQTLREAHRAGAKNIAVVCGAWHVAALTAWQQIKAASDSALLKELKKVKTEATWIPWSFDRLSLQSGYSAGVIAPAWYQTLWEYTPSASATAVWLTQAARLLREHDVETSSAHIIESVRLSDTLASLRLTQQPGIEELRQAVTAVMGLHSEKPLQLLESRLIVGDVLGQVPTVLPTPPLKADFEAQVKSCRLERSTADTRLELDLRQKAHLRKSILLHRVTLMGIPWGQPMPVEGNKQGAFHEHWNLKWLPDYEIRFIEAATWGNTVEMAASHLALRRTEETESLPSLSTLLERLLQADLPAVLSVLLHKLQQVSALSADALRLADVLPGLVNALRYGQARQVDVRLLYEMADQMIPRLCLQLPAACALLQEDAAVEALRKLLALNRAFGILQVPVHTARWRQALRSIQESSQSAPLLSGLSTRLLFDQGELTAEQTELLMHYHLSAGEVAAVAAAWLEGFLQGSGLLLMHHPALWRILDAWVSHLDDEAFQELLPLLRRSFSRLSAPERGKLLDLARRSGSPDVAASVLAGADQWDEERAAAVLQVIRPWF